MNQRDDGKKNNRSNDVAVDQEQTSEEQDKADVNRITADGKCSIGDQGRGLALVDPHSKRCSKTYKGIDKKEKSGDRDCQTSPSWDVARPKPLDKDTKYWPTKSGSDDKIDKCESAGNDDEISLMGYAKHDCVNTLPAQHSCPGQNREYKKSKNNNAYEVLDSHGNLPL